MSDVVIAEIIRAGALLLSVLLPVFAAVAFFKWKRRQDRYRDKFQTALRDLQFMIAVENEYAQYSVELEGRSNRRLMRQLANKNAKWSGRFTPAQIHKELARVEREESNDSSWLNRFTSIKPIN